MILQLVVKAIHVDDDSEAREIAMMGFERGLSYDGLGHMA
jgi:hypothetical protein